MPDEHGGYRFYDRTENQPTQIEPIEDIEPPATLDDKLMDVFHKVLLIDQTNDQCFDQSIMQRKQDLAELETLVLTAELDQLKCWTPTMLRLSQRCPFHTVRSKMNEILIKLQDKCRTASSKSEKLESQAKSGKRRKFQLSSVCSIFPHPLVCQPSKYVLIDFNCDRFNFNCDDKQKTNLKRVQESGTEFRQSLPDDERRKIALLEHWREFHRIDHLALVVSMHVSYFELWRKFMFMLFDFDNIGLDRIERIYIGIMAAGSRQSSYLFHILKEEFKNELVRVNRYEYKYSEWLEDGFDSLPPKFRELSVLNEKMAGRPWELTADDISKLTTNENDDNECWRESDLIYAIIILAWCHSLAGACFGLGVNAELDHKAGHTFRAPSTVYDDSEADDSEDSEDKVDSLVDKMESLKARNRVRTESQKGSDYDPQKEKELNHENFINLLKDRNNDVFDPSDEEGPSDDEHMVTGELNKYLSKANRNGQLQGKHNALTTPKKCDDANLRLHEYNWKPTQRCPENALDTISDGISGIKLKELIQTMDRKFDHIQNLTYQRMGAREEIDTKMFRYAIWDYASCLMGIMSDESPYDHIDIFTDEDKEYLKHLILYPSKVTRKQYDHFCPGFRPDEKVHVNLICLEARFQAELLYAMRAFGESSRLQ